MPFGRIMRIISSSIFAMSIFLQTTGVAQAQCIFFTGFTDNKDGTVTDTRNGLIWKRCAEGFDFSNGVCTGSVARVTFESARLMAKQNRFLDKDDWRLPTIEEFEAVLGNLEECGDNRDGAYAASKAIAHIGGGYWSSSPSLGGENSAQFVDFDNGHVDRYGYRDGSLYVRLVRSGQVLGGDIALEFVNEMEERRQLDDAYRRAEAPNILKGMSKDWVCAAYGKALREGKVDGIGAFSDIAKLVKKELTRRKLKLDDSLTRKEFIRIGVSECQLYASLGEPENQNRTVGSWGVHIQHVYGSGTYVYTENGRVTSWQD